MKNSANPFKFGTIVDNEYFTDRVEEVAYISQFLDSPNHLILISPRRYGKSSVVARAVKLFARQAITLNLQQVTSVADLSAKLLREFFKIHPVERLRHLITHFRIVPTISANPLTGAVDVSFRPDADGTVMLEDVLNLMEKARSGKQRLVVVLDEFQEIMDIAPGLDRMMRAIMQTQTNINYILLGSQESMMTDIFENKKSPFYHFGELMRLKKLPYGDLHDYLSKRLAFCFPDDSDDVAAQILDYTACHPYYSQQLASNVWQFAMLYPDRENVVENAVDNIVESHGLDYERLWANFTRTGKWIMQRLASSCDLHAGNYPVSTVYSALKQFQKKGYVVYSDRYEIEDPFFRKWIENGTK